MKTLLISPQRSQRIRRKVLPVVSVVVKTKKTGVCLRLRYNVYEDFCMVFKGVYVRNTADCFWVCVLLQFLPAATGAGSCCSASNPFPTPRRQTATTSTMIPV